MDFYSVNVSNKHSATLSLSDNCRTLLNYWVETKMSIEYHGLFSGTLFEMGDTKVVYKHNFVQSLCFAKLF